MWDLVEHPESSCAANLVSFISMMFVIVSTIGMALNTMPGLKVWVLSPSSSVIINQVPLLQVMDEEGELQNNPLLETIEAVCIAWFTMEYFLRYSGRYNMHQAAR